MVTDFCTFLKKNNANVFSFCFCELLYLNGSTKTSRSTTNDKYIHLVHNALFFLHLFRCVLLTKSISSMEETTAWGG